MYKYKISLTLTNYYLGIYYKLKEDTLAFVSFIVLAVLLIPMFLMGNPFYIASIALGLILFVVTLPIFKYSMAHMKYKFTEMEYFFDKEDFGYVMGSYTAKVLKSEVIDVRIRKGYLKIKTKHQDMIFVFNQEIAEELKDNLVKYEYPLVK
jgi:hypothetical protein